MFSLCKIKIRVKDHMVLSPHYNDLLIYHQLQNVYATLFELRNIILCTWWCWGLAANFRFNNKILWDWVVFFIFIWIKEIFLTVWKRWVTAVHGLQHIVQMQNIAMKNLNYICRMISFIQVYFFSENTKCYVTCSGRWFKVDWKNRVCFLVQLRAQDLLA